jgi:putative FmdB family regulatory protein
MPTYLYECENCGRFEEFQNIKEDALDECPECKGEVKRIIGSPGIIFKGSNFYVNQDNSSAKDTGSKDEKVS